jgi:uncharacterized protein
MLMEREKNTSKMNELEQRAVERAAGVLAAEESAEPHHEPTNPIRLPVRHNHRLTTIVQRANADAELKAIWQAANVNAVDRLGMSDHGPVHVQIVANIGLKLLRMLMEHGAEAGIVHDHGLTPDDAEVVVVLGALLHDLGIAIHREKHEEHSLFLAWGKARELLEGLYDVPTRTIVATECLHAIHAHQKAAKPLTLEAGALKVADALDMSRGRSRIPFESGQVNIHSLSAVSIERVEILRGEERPIQIKITMTNSAGIFQVDELLKGKLETSGIAQYFEVVAVSTSEKEQRLVERYRI